MLRVGDILAVVGNVSTWALKDCGQFGMLGPNGAGKTTSSSMAVGLLRPDAGTAKIFGVDVWSDPTRANGGLTYLRAKPAPGGSAVAAAE